MSNTELSVEGRSLAGRMYSIEALHRLVPDALAMRIAWLIGRLRWYWPPARRRAIARVSLTVARTPREAEVQKLAKRELSIHAMRVELDWRPWMLVNARFSGEKRLEQVRAGGRPMLLTGAHLGGGSSLAVALRGYPYAAAAGLWMDPRAKGYRRGYHGYKARARRRLGEAAGLKYVPIGGSYDALRDLLAAGETCLVLCDVPGKMRSRMAGKAARLASGTARLAWETGAMVVPILGLLHTDGPHVEILEPLDPHDFDGPQQLLDRLAEIYGQAMIEHPEQVEPIGFTRETFAEDGGSYPLDLWWPSPLRKRAMGRLLQRPRRKDSSRPC